MKRFYAETWEDERELCVFDTEEERQEWLNENCYTNDSGSYLKETDERVAFYEA